MKQWHIAVLSSILALSLLLSACAGEAGAAQENAAEPASDAVQKLTPEQAKARMDSGDAVLVVDVRTAEEYAQGHVPGAVLLPVTELEADAPTRLPVQDAEILVYCRSGNRSAQAAQLLQGMGYTKVADFGGIQNWTYETQTGAWEEKQGGWNSFRTASLAGALVDESVFADAKLTMVSVWATTCGYCIQEMPELAQLNRTYGDRGFQVVGLVADTYRGDGTFQQAQIEQARSLSERAGADYLQLLPMADLQAAVSAVQAYPAALFVDSEGNVVQEIAYGMRSAEQWSTVIEALLVQQGA